SGEHNIFIGIQSLVGRAGAASTAADEAKAKGIGILFGKKFAGQNSGRNQSAANQSRGFQEFTAIGRMIQGSVHDTNSWTYKETERLIKVNSQIFAQSAFGKPVCIV